MKIYKISLNDDKWVKAMLPELQHFSMSDNSQANTLFTASQMKNLYLFYNHAL
jgi:hypothetical protein